MKIQIVVQTGVENGNNYPGSSAKKANFHAKSRGWIKSPYQGHSELVSESQSNENEILK
jgi:hypothetical protein